MMGPELHATMAIDAGFKEVVDLADYNLPIAGSSFIVDREWYRKRRGSHRLDEDQQGIGIQGHAQVVPDE
jgi:hypothetical protein